MKDEIVMGVVWASCAVACVAVGICFHDISFKPAVCKYLVCYTAKVEEGTCEGNITLTSKRPLCTDKDVEEVRSGIASNLPTLTGKVVILNLMRLE